jgi:CheY-like chemotaxis protein
LGLAVVYGIVSAHKGVIQVKSEPARGTTFEVFFPCIRSSADQKPISYEQPYPGEESILFIDDEAALVRLATKLLEKCGYRVVGHTNPLEALALFKDDPYKFDLVITDMTMPHMTGSQLVQALQKIRTDVPIIITTGYSEKISPEKAQMMGVQDLIMKPLGYGDLTKRIRKVIEQKESKVVDNR